MSGQASTTSSGSTRAMSAITRSGASTLSVVTSRCLKQTFQFPAEEEVDPDKQDRRHALDTTTRRGRG